MRSHFRPKRRRISKRTRFEILRRDGFACVYCGRRSPEVALELDHVFPIRLGGSNDPSNLATSCRDCNAGKSGIAPLLPEIAAMGGDEVIDEFLAWVQALEPEEVDRIVSGSPLDPSVVDRWLGGES